MDVITFHAGISKVVELDRELHLPQHTTIAPDVN